LENESKPLEDIFSELERDLELERRKVRELQEGSRERDREYAKLKVTLVDRIPFGVLS
jgi:E3 ubiquitin-protein ligase CCNP1IP1